MTHRHIPGTDPLAPQPYSAAERADLVERTRMAMIPARGRGCVFTSASARAAVERREELRRLRGQQ